MANPEAEGSEPEDSSADSVASAPGFWDPQSCGPSGSSSPGELASGDPASHDLEPLEVSSNDLSNGLSTDIVLGDSNKEAVADGMDDFQRLQRRLQWITLCLAAGAVLITVLVFDRSTAFSLSIGAVGALLYLRLLARSVSRLGENSRSVGKVQLLVPIVLVLAASRLPQLSILPVFLGFLLYKPAVIIQALTDT